ncbi:MAG: hypothetical protein AAF934_05215 [Bacteroidota bacterium]
MKTLSTYSIVSFVLLFIVACGGDGGGNNTPPLPPSAAGLVFPADNTECNEGTVISDTQSTVTFMWNTSENTDRYTLNIRNLNTGQLQALNISTGTQLEVTILRGEPYEWWVVSANDETPETTQSEVWRFYNAGLAVENYAPFPAEVNSPPMGTAVDAVSGEVTLTWAGGDIDDDIADYDIYFGTATPPVILAGSTSDTSFNVAVTPGEIYYWTVTTRDNQGNTSASEVFEFRVTN